MKDASPSQGHRANAARMAEKQPVTCAVLTISDTRTPETDQGGPLVEQLLERAGHECLKRAIVKDDPAQIEPQLTEWIDSGRFHAILTTGGTGISTRDTTIEVVRRLIDIELEGFGELFRMLSFQEVQGAAMLSRAVGGLVLPGRPSGDQRGVFIFAMPGSPHAIETAMTNLIVPQLAHLVWERKR
jgi:molybdopterin adenylyltransferase